MRTKPRIVTFDSTSGLDPRNVSILNDNFRSLMLSIPDDGYLTSMFEQMLGDYSIEDGHVVIPEGNTFLNLLATFIEDLIDNPREQGE